MNFERVAYALLCQLPFIFLYPHAGYSIFTFPLVWQKVIVGAFFLLFSMLAEGAVHALLFRAFRCRLSAGELSELTLLWLFTGTGVIHAFGVIPFYFLSLSCVILSVVLLKNASAVPFSIVLSLPLALVQVSAIPLAVYAVLGGAALLFVPYGNAASSLSFTSVYLGIMYLEGLYTRGTAEIVLTVLACAAPAVAVCCIPEKLFRKAKNTLLFYRERTLPRIAINRNRRAVGEQLYEVSALFREIENSFREKPMADNSSRQLREKLEDTLCKTCPNRRKCEDAHVRESLDKLIAVGKAKGRVNLIDMPAELSSLCGNSAGMLLDHNKQLAEYRRYFAE